MGDHCRAGQPAGAGGRGASGPLRPLAAFLVLPVLLVFAGVGTAQEIDVEKATRVKAAYLYNFTKFVTWPETSFADDKAPMVIGVLGDDQIGDILDETMRERTVNGRGIKIRRLKSHEAGGPPAPEELRACHMVFVSASERPRLTELLERVEGASVLMVSDMEGFAHEGGAIELALEAGRIVFKVNRQATEGAHLKLSAKLLRLARIVGEGDETKKPKGDEGRDKKGTEG